MVPNFAQAMPGDSDSIKSVNTGCSHDDLHISPLHIDNIDLEPLP